MKDISTGNAISLYCNTNTSHYIHLFFLSDRKTLDK